MANFTLFLIYALVTTFTPGPNNLMAMSNAMRYGYQRTIRFLTGIFAGFFAVMLLCGLLNLALATQLPSLRHWLNVLGAGYMLTLAFHILRSKPIEDDFGENGLNSFRAGFAMQFINLKVILYGITVFSLFILSTYQNPIIICLFSLLLAGVGYLSSTCWAFGGSLFRNLSPKNYQIFNFVMGGLLIYAAIASLF
jgi:cysteine/O-acetylserine efflux protein